MEEGLDTHELVGNLSALTTEFQYCWQLLGAINCCLGLRH